MTKPQIEIEESTPEFPLLGWQVQWRISGVQIAHDDFKKLLAKHGFQDFVPQLPPLNTSLHRAVAEWVELRAEQGVGPSLSRRSRFEQDEDEEVTKETALIRAITVPTGNPYLVFALVTERIDVEDIGLDYATSMRILLHKQHHTLICTTNPRGIVAEVENQPKRKRGRPSKADKLAQQEAESALLKEQQEQDEQPEESLTESQQLTRELRPLWAKYQSMITSNECSRIIRKIITSMNSVATRNRGGVYFVPLAERATLTRLNKFIADLPTPHLEEGSPRRPFMYAAGVIDRPAAKRQLSVAVHAGILDEVEAVAKRLERFTGQDDKSVKGNTIVDRMREFHKVKTKAQSYADLCGLQAESILSVVKKLETQALNIVLADDQEIDPETINTPTPRLRPVPLAPAANPPQDEDEAVSTVASGS